MGQKVTSVFDFSSSPSFSVDSKPSSTMSSQKAESSFMDMLEHFNIWYLIYICAAIMFFNLGKSFGEVKSKMEERKGKSKRNRHYKKNEEMDEE